MQLFWLSSCCSTHVYHPSSSKSQHQFEKNRKVLASLKQLHVKSTQCLILSAPSITQCITPKSETHLGNEGHINMCCDNSCERVTLQGREVVPFTLDCHEIREWFRWKSKTQHDHHRLRRQSGESTVDDVTTRQTRQKVSTNMFLPGAYKPLPGFSSHRPVTVTAAL